MKLIFFCFDIKVQEKLERAPLTVQFKSKSDGILSFPIWKTSEWQ